MRTLIISEHHRSDRIIRTLHVEHRRVLVYDRDGRSYRFDLDLDDLDLATATAWEILARVAPAIVVEEDKRDALDYLAQRCREGWEPTPGKIVLGVRQRTLTDSHMAIDAIRYPEDPDGEYYSPATKLLGRDVDGRVQPTGEILWIAADRGWAVCEDAFYWLPPADSQ